LPSRELAAFYIDLKGKILQRFDAAAAGAAMKEVGRNDAVAPIAIIAEIRFDVGPIGAIFEIQ